MDSYKNILGRSAWAFLHVLAKGYPHNPTKRDKLYMKSFLDNFILIYPCKVCAEHMKHMFKKNPYELDSRRDFMMYVCKIHNIVNKRLGKEIFECHIDNL